VASQPGYHGPIVALDEGDARPACERPDDVVQAQVELPGEAVGHGARFDDRMQARDWSPPLGSVDSAPERRLLRGARLRVRRLVGQPDGP
jgi:hypothetical protein